MLKALWTGVLVFIPFGLFVLITFFVLKHPSIYQFLHERRYATFPVLLLASAMITGLYFHILNRALLQRVEGMAQWRFPVRWAAVVVTGSTAAVIVSVVFAATVLLLSYIALLISGKRLS